MFVCLCLLNTNNFVKILHTQYTYHVYTMPLYIYKTLAVTVRLYYIIVCTQIQKS